MTLYAGIDAGGTRTRVLTEDSVETRQTTSGPVNLQQLGVSSAARRLAESLKLAFHEVPGDAQVRVVAGVAGAGRPADRRHLHDQVILELQGWNPAHLTVLTDADLALEAAFSGAGGLIVIAGTGSIVLAQRDDGTRLRSGGWGSLLGDEGSGHDIGLMGLRAVARAYDGGSPTRLTNHAPPSERLVEAVYAERLSPSDFAPHVLEEAAGGDAVALNIVTNRAGALAQTVHRLTSRADALQKRIVLFGGLIGSSLYANSLRAAISEASPDWTFTEPHCTPVEAALHLAKRRPTGTH